MLTFLNNNSPEDRLYKNLTVIRNRKMDFDPWVFLSDDEIIKTSAGINSHYPYRNILCFAHKQGSDDYVCLITKGELTGKFIFIHWFASPGWETGKNSELDSFGNVLEAIISDMIDNNIL
ncbi:hypothetical protein [Bartonella sp. HY761]|uniref:hypothetical protein n=1 Tax=Bartonella sp. HY761 TaxID=2979330 RepID=UPI0021FFE727|nr:hypothetical protein [Bartonella sp. HY761]UXN06322.1 hypothetical protein N6A79_13805 [Bartonella sp. HY761]